MKKIFILAIFLYISVPVFAVCSITGGACSAPVNFEANTLKDRLIPNNLQQLKRTDHFQHQIGTPYGTNVNTTSQTARPNPESSSFDSDYEFGNNSPSQTNIQE